MDLYHALCIRQAIEVDRGYDLIFLPGTPVDDAHLCLEYLERERYIITHEVPKGLRILVCGHNYIDDGEDSHIFCLADNEHRSDGEEE